MPIKICKKHAVIKMIKQINRLLNIITL